MRSEGLDTEDAFYVQVEIIKPDLLCASTVLFFFFAQFFFLLTSFSAIFSILIRRQDLAQLPANLLSSLQSDRCFYMLPFQLHSICALFCCCCCSVYMQIRLAIAYYTNRLLLNQSIFSRFYCLISLIFDQKSIHLFKCMCRFFYIFFFSLHCLNDLNKNHKT